MAVNESNGFWTKEEVLGEVEKNGGSIIVIKKCWKGDQTYLDIRESYKKDAYWLPTKKGICIPITNGAASDVLAIAMGALDDAPADEDEDFEEDEDGY